MYVIYWNTGQTTNRRLNTRDRQSHLICTQNATPHPDPPTQLQPYKPTASCALIGQPVEGRGLQSSHWLTVQSFIFCPRDDRYPERPVNKSCVTLFKVFQCWYQPLIFNNVLRCSFQTAFVINSLTTEGKQQKKHTVIHNMFLHIQRVC